MQCRLVQGSAALRRSGPVLRPVEKRAGRGNGSAKTATAGYQLDAIHSALGATANHRAVQY